LPIRIPAAPLTYPAQKSADIFFFEFEKIAFLPQDHGTELRQGDFQSFSPSFKITIPLEQDVSTPSAGMQAQPQDQNNL
jgi:hypothetical protein